MRGSMLLVLLLLWAQDTVKSVRVIELRVPAHAAAGGEALLGCEFDMEGDSLYSVKWYKDGREFFRYMPRSPHPMQRFVTNGVTVDMNRSSMDLVTLVRLNQDTAGVYRCEVSGEKPLFTTAADQKYITIDVLPKTGPKISGLQFSYEIGDRVIANCTSPPSKPEAQLKWLVNKKSVSKAHLRGPWLRVVYDPPGAKESTLEIRFMVLPSHYRFGVMEITCQATIAPLYQREQAFVLTKPEPVTKPPRPWTETNYKLPATSEHIPENIPEFIPELPREYRFEERTTENAVVPIVPKEYRFEEQRTTEDVIVPIVPKEYRFEEQRTTENFIQTQDGPDKAAERGKMSYKDTQKYQEKLVSTYDNFSKEIRFDLPSKRASTTTEDPDDYDIDGQTMWKSVPVMVVTLCLQLLLVL